MNRVSLIIELASMGIKPVVYVGLHICRSEGWCEHPFAAAFFVFVYILMQIQGFVNMLKTKSRFIKAFG